MPWGELWTGQKDLALTELTLTANSISQLIVVVKMATNEKNKVLRAP